jgi:hypothetical protein
VDKGLLLSGTWRSTASPSRRCCRPVGTCKRVHRAGRRRRRSSSSIGGVGGVCIVATAIINQRAKDGGESGTGAPASSFEQAHHHKGPAAVATERDGAVVVDTFVIVMEVGSRPAPPTVLGGTLPERPLFNARCVEAVLAFRVGCCST